MNNLFINITAGNPKRLIKPSILTALANLSNLVPFLCLAYIIGAIYDFFSVGLLESHKLWIAFAVMVIFFLVTDVLENLACRATFHDGYKVSAEGRVKLAEHIRKLPLGLLSGKRSSEITQTMMSDFSQTETAMTHVLPQMIAGVLVAVIAPLVMVFIDWRMTLASFIGFPLATLLIKGTQSLTKRAQKKITDAGVAQADSISEYLYGMEVIKSYNLQGDNFEKLKKACVHYRDAHIQAEGSITPLYLVAGALLRSGLSIMTLVGVYLLIGGNLDVSTFALFLLIGARIFDPLTGSIMNISSLMAGSAAGKRIVKLLNEDVMSGSEEVPDAHDIIFTDVSFAYNKADVGDSPSVLSSLCLAFPENSLTALVGPSGSGKTTALRLAARFYDPIQGVVHFGGKDETRMDPEKLMSKISVVFQDVYLFQDSIANNIRYGKESASDDEIRQAAKLANCDFIEKMPSGFETMVGEGGCTLSGGERQRISIARAILKDAPVVMLDEATSSLDPENESQVQQAINRLVQGRTVIVIAHRLKTIIGADNIIVLDQGKKVEEGTHQELLNQNGLYARLWHLQTKSEGWQV